jgi:hypothetical protein
MRRHSLAGAMVLTACVTGALGTRALIPRVGDAMARRAIAMAAIVPTVSTADSLDDDTPAEVTADPLDAGTLGDAAPGRVAGRARSSEAIDIPAERLARLTARQLRSIGATDAVDEGGHPVGARLHGVGRLGVGLADGDVVTSIEGRPTLGADDATAAAIGAYASGEPVAHATLLREGRTVRVTVHVPAGDAGRAP